jgi:hypothetical protein
VTLTSLYLRSNNIGAEGALSLAAALHNNATLTSLDLADNNIGAEGARSLAAALGNNATLTSLSLRSNSLGHEGARSLAAALKINAMLTSLDLRWIEIGDEGARSLTAALDPNRALQRLDLSINDDLGYVEKWCTLSNRPSRLSTRATRLPAYLTFQHTHSAGACQGRCPAARPLLQEDLLTVMRC